MTVRETLSVPRRCMILFYEFARISLFVVGGGLVIVPAAQEVFLQKRRWFSEDELSDLLTVVQTVPGFLAGNAAVYIGYRAAGVAGGAAALFGALLPPLVIIVAIASGLAAVGTGHPMVRGAFTGVVAAVTGMVAALVWKNGKKTQKSLFAWVVAACCFVGMVWLRMNPGGLMLLAAVAGIVYTACRKKV